MCGTNTTNAQPVCVCVCVQKNKNIKFSKNVRFALTKQAKPTTKQAKPKKNNRQPHLSHWQCVVLTQPILHRGVCVCVCVQNKKNMKFSKNVRFALTRQAQPTTKQAKPKKKTTGNLTYHIGNVWY